MAPFLVGTVSVVIMFLANTLITYSQQLFKKEIEPEAVAQLILFSIPTALNLTLPIAVTIAAGLAVSRLTRENELTAMRAAGISLKRAFAPILLMGLVVSVFSFWWTESVRPEAEARAKDTLRKIFAVEEAFTARSNIVIKLDDGRYHLSIGSAQKGPGGKVLIKNILVFSKPARGKDQIVQAAKAEYDGRLLILEQARIWEFDGDRFAEFKVKGQYIISPRISLETFFGQPLPGEQTIQELREKVSELKSMGILHRAREYEVEYHNRFSIPFACLVFALFAPIFAVRFSRGGAFIGVLLSIVIVFLYYNMWLFSAEVLANRLGWLSPVVGSWLPNVLFLFVGLVALWRSE